MSAELVRVRAGIPRFAARVRAGASATIVAYGTSMTLFGQYLSHLPAMLEAETGNAQIRLINRGLRGFFTFAGAFRVTGDVVPHAPDLVLIEFAHNDAEPDALDMIPPALDGIIAQVRRVNPDCEFAFVYLSPPGVAAAGPSAAVQIYEEIAAYYGFPSFDLAALSERLVAAGEAGWTSGPGPVLTTDGIHHTDAARDLIGGPFAAAFSALLRASGHSPSGPRRVLDPSLEVTDRSPAATHLTTGRWATGLPPNHESRTCQAYDEEVAEPLEIGAALEFAFEGTRAFLWAMGTGALRIIFRGSPYWHRIDVQTGAAWSFHTLSPPLASGPYTIGVVAIELPLVLGDIFIVGRLSAGTGAPDMVK